MLLGMARCREVSLLMPVSTALYDDNDAANLDITVTLQGHSQFFPTVKLCHGKVISSLHILPTNKSNHPKTAPWLNRHVRYSHDPLAHSGSEFWLRVITSMQNLQSTGHM